MAKKKTKIMIDGAGNVAQRVEPPMECLPSHEFLKWRQLRTVN